MKRRWRWGLCGVLTAVFVPAQAAPVVAGIAARRPASVHPEAERAFLAGAGAAGGAPTAVGPATRAQQQAAVKALEVGEAAYLEFKLKNAETALNQAVEGLLASPGELEDAEPAVRAVLLLAQVLVARKQPDAADLVLERALQTLPGFPRGGQPPPDIQARIEGVRTRMSGQLTASLTVESSPPGASVRLNGVPVGEAPVKLDRLAPGPVRVRILSKDQGANREVVLKAGHQTVRLPEGPGAGGGRLIAALVAGDEAGARRAARALQAAAGADQACAGLVVGSRAWLFHFVGDEVTAEQDAVPASLAEWGRLGQRCAPGAARGTPADPSEIWQETTEIGIEPIEPVTPEDDRWAYTALAGSAVAAGVGAWLGVAAQDAADEFNRTGATAEEDRARRDALLADVSFTVAVGLVITGVYLLVAD